MPKELNYTLGHGDRLVGAYGLRGVSQEARFIVPFLQPGMSVLDCGCGPGTITVGLAECVAPGHLPAGTLRALQLSDANIDVRATGTQPPTRDRLLPGDGVMPLMEIVRLALANRADVSLGLEVFNRELAQLPYTELAVRAKTALDALLSAVADDG